MIAVDRCVQACRNVQEAQSVTLLTELDPDACHTVEGLSTVSCTDGSYDTPLYIAL